MEYYYICNNNIAIVQYNQPCYLLLSFLISVSFLWYQNLSSLVFVSQYINGSRFLFTNLSRPSRFVFISMSFYFGFVPLDCRLSLILCRYLYLLFWGPFGNSQSVFLLTIYFNQLDRNISSSQSFFFSWRHYPLVWCCSA